jgi:AAA domain
MPTTLIATPDPAGRRRRNALHNISLTRKEDWEKFVNAKPRTKPDILSRNEISTLSDAALDSYNAKRRDWHANLGPFQTPQYRALHDDLWAIVDSNVQDGDRAKGAVAVSSFPGLGKTTTMQQFGKQFHRQEINAYGSRTDAGNQRWPVVWVGLTGNPSLRDFNRSMLSFLAHPGSERGTAAQYLHRALDCMLACEVKLLIIDDLHFLRFPSTNSVEVSNHFKFIANSFPVTLVYVGVGLTDSGLMSDGKRVGEPDEKPVGTAGFMTEGRPFNTAVLAQTGRRTTALTMDRFRMRTAVERAVWRELLLTIEHRLVLADNGRGMLADSLLDYLFERTTGHIGSLMTLITRGCARAIRNGAEELTKELLEEVKLDAASEKARNQTAAEVRSSKRKPRKK